MPDYGDRQDSGADGDIFAAGRPDFVRAGLYLCGAGKFYGVSLSHSRASGDISGRDDGSSAIPSGKGESSG